LRAFGEDGTIECFAAGGLDGFLNVGDGALGLEGVEKGEKVVERVAGDGGKGGHAAAEAALVDEIRDLGIFEAAEATGDLGTVFAAHAVAAVADGAVVVVDHVAGVFIGVLGLGEGGKQQQSEDDGGEAETQEEILSGRE